MACILHIETSARICSVALSQDGQLLYHEEDSKPHNHGVSCGVFVDHALSFANSHAILVEAVAVSEGPGSYTGLRIGVSMAKGICYGRQLPLIAVPTPEIMCVPLLLSPKELPDEALLVPMIDARRMEVYATVYDKALQIVRPIQPDVVTADTYVEYLEKGNVWFFGDGAAKCKDVIQLPHAHFVEGIEPLAKNMFPLAERLMHEKKFKDVAYFEPFYLKDFIATTPKKLI